jgi:N-acyl-D-amino-acid deacylase
MLDILIRGGWVVDGTGNPARPADVAIHGERIAEVGRLAAAQAATVVDATGKYVCPGLVDCHSHSDWSIFANPLAQSTIRQGITAEVVGNCGNGSAPVSEESLEAVEAQLRDYAYGEPPTWHTYAEYLEAVRRKGISPNLVWLVGHNTIRQAAGVIGPHATEQQLAQMEALTAEAMEAGAVGLSTGLEFEPGRTAPTEEIIRVARVAGRYGGMYVSHIRNRDAHLQDAIDEFLAIVRASGCRGSVSHLNVRHNTGAPEGAWQRAVDSLEAARQEGLDVLADCTPFVDGLGMLAAILPPWLKAEGPARAAELLGDASVRARLRNECDRYWRFLHRGEWHRVRMMTNPVFPDLAGKSFAEIAEHWGKDPWDVCFDLLAGYGAGMDNLTVIGQLFTEEHVLAQARHPLFCLGVDGFTSSTDPALAIPCAHPIHYCGMTHYLTHHVRAKRALRLEEAIRKMTSMPATHFGLRDRGLLRAGSYADVMVFDFDALEDVSTVEQPVAYVRGVEHVWVNGVPVVTAGEHTGARPGRNLLRS